MKRILLSVAVGFSLAFSARAQSPLYVTKNNSGTTACQVNFSAVPGAQMRLVGVIGTSDKAASVFSIRHGTTAYTVTVATNAASANVYVNTTNGIAPSDLFILQKSDGTITNATVTAPTGYSNITFSAALGVVPAVGDTLYKLSGATTIKCAAATTVYQGESIYAALPGRPLRVLLDGTSACSLDSITVRVQ